MCDNERSDESSFLVSSCGGWRKISFSLLKADEDAKSRPSIRERRNIRLSILLRLLFFVCVTLRFSLCMAGGKKQVKCLFVLFFFVVVKLITSFRFAPQNTRTTVLLLEIQKRDTSVHAFVDTRWDVREEEIIRCPPPFILSRRFALGLIFFGRWLHRVFRFRATKRDFFTSIVSTRFVAKSACVFQPVVLFDLEKTEGENTPVRGASVREESETIFVLSGVLLRVVVQKSSLGCVD